MAVADLHFLQFVEAWRTPFLDQFFLIVTRFGEELVLLPLICLIYWCFNKRLAIYLGINFFVALLANHLLKITFAIQRPWVRNPDLRPVPKAMGSATGFSFPSGHTAGAVSVYGSAALWASKIRWLKGLLWTLILLVMISRIYLGVHTPLDVLVSFLVGLCLLALTRLIFVFLERKPDQDWKIVLGFLLAILLGLVYTLLKPYPAMTSEALKADGMKSFGAAGGAVVGWLWERRKIHFTEIQKGVQLFFVFLAGLAGVFAIRIGLKTLFLTSFGLLAGNFLRYFLIGIWIIGIYPFLFMAVLQRNKAVSDQ